jgi:TRAP-type C4-dicarboxylate transport system substrate-binding protein
MRTPGGKLFVEFYKTLGADPRIVGFNSLYETLAGARWTGRRIRS